MFKDEVIGKGFLRADGKKGIRNKVIVCFTVDCSSFVASKIAEHFKRIGDDVDFLGTRSCVDNPVNVRRLLSYSVHPNVGAVLVVGHGCEHNRPEKISDFARNGGRLADWFYQQDAGGSKKSIAKGIDIVTGFIQELRKTPRAPLYVKDLTFGAQCGGSDFSSGLAGNPLVGNFFDRAIDLGATCVFAEVSESAGLKEFLVKRGIDEDARRDLANYCDKIAYIYLSAGQFSIGPGNIEGGLTTIEEKGMGSVAKGGSKAITGVIKIAQRPKKPGLYMLDQTSDVVFNSAISQGGDSYTGMELISVGSHINFLVAGRGHVVGNPISPCVKITGNPKTFENMIDDIDINAGQILLGNKTLDQMTDELFDYAKAICGGMKVKAEVLGHQESEFSHLMQDPCRVIRPAGI